MLDETRTILGVFDYRDSAVNFMLRSRETVGDGNDITDIVLVEGSTTVE
jgi:hypothetical protein